MRADLTVLGDAVIVAVKGYVGKAMASLSARLDEFDQRLKSIPTAERDSPGKDADPVVIRQMVEAEVAKLPKPEKGEDGKSVDVVELSVQIIEAAAKAVDALPKPKNGRDYDPALLDAAVIRAVEALPPPAAGKDADPEAIASAVLEKVMLVVKAIPAPTNGKDADPEVLRQAVKDEVESVLATWPKPKDGDPGKSVDPVEFSGQIVAAAAAAVKSMPVPRDGKDYELEVLEAAVKRAVDQIPRPEPGAPGKSVTLEDIAPLVVAEVARVAESFKPEKGEAGRDADPLLIALEVKTQLAAAVQGLPKPAPGKDADPEVLQAAVESAVAEQIKTLPPATPGKDADPELMAREIATRVDAVVKALPPPEPGKDADAEAIGSAVLEKVLKVLDEIPPPAPGKDADPAAVEKMVNAEVDRLWQTLPKPQDGKSVDMVQLAGDIAAAAAKAVQAIEKPADGKDFDPELLKSEVERVVASSAEALAESLWTKTEAALKAHLPTPDKAAERAVIADVLLEQIAKLPKPADGKDADPEKVAAVVAEQLAVALKAMPPPEPGKDADPAVIARMIDDRFALISKPENGKDYDPEVLRAAVADAVGKIEIPAAVPTEIDPEVLRAEVAKQVADIEVPAPTVDPALIRAECERAAKALPKPRDGDSVPVEQVERMVADAVAKAMADIKLPKDGDPGRDALAIEILPAIDESKSYPRGTFAIHNGGTWHSFERTNGMRGWECSNDGLAELGFEQDVEDPRLITVKGTMSSGKTVVATMHIPAVIDKGVYREGELYSKADGVTWGRNFWIAQKNTKEKPEPNGGDWRLSVKSGRDGASAFDIARRHGFVGTETEWLASLRASKSVPGRE